MNKVNDNNSNNASPEHFDVIISSTAKRASLTAQYVAEQLKFDLDAIEQNPEVYEASIRSLLETVNKLDNGYDRVLIIGHNPSFRYLAEYLCNETISDFPTCGAFCITFEINNWEEVSQNTGHKDWFIYPKMFEM